MHQTHLLCAKDTLVHNDRYTRDITENKVNIVKSLALIKLYHLEQQITYFKK